MSTPKLPNPRFASGSGGSGDGDEPKDVRIVGGISLEPRDVRDTDDQAFWSRIRTSSELLSFDSFDKFIDEAFCRLVGRAGDRHDRGRKSPAQLPFPDIQSYRALKGAAEVFMEFACGVRVEALDDWERAFERDASRLQLELDGQDGADVLEGLWDSYVDSKNGMELDDVIPYLVEVRGNLRPSGFRPQNKKGVDRVELCEFLIAEKFVFPCLVELIWSYWHEEGLLVRSIDAISWRFQNRGAGTGHEPLAELEITPLRPLNNVLWGYIQDRQHRLSAQRRLFEYNHEYGLRAAGGQAVDLRPADSRSRFLDAFHLLLQKSAAFFKEDDDATVVADGFPVLNATARSAHHPRRGSPQPVR